MKQCFEPVFYAYLQSNQSLSKSSEPLQFKEYYHRLILELDDYNHRRNCKLKTDNIAGGIIRHEVYYHVGKIKLWRQSCIRDSTENHPLVLQAIPPASVQSISHLTPPSTSPRPLPHPITVNGLHRNAQNIERWNREGDTFLTNGDIDKATVAFGKALQAAEDMKDQMLISDCLKNLGKAALEMVTLNSKDWMRPALFFNSALALCQQDTERCNDLLKLMADVERRYLKIVCGIAHVDINPEDYLKRRQELKDMRVFVKLGPGRSVEETQATIKQFSHNIRLFLATLFKGVENILGPPPCLYALIALGSFGREEMCFFSDVEFAAIVDKLTSEVRQWFNKSIPLYHIRVINLGETKFEILRGRKSAMPTGCEFDPGGNVPIGGKEDLVRTPYDMASFQSATNFGRDIVICTALRSTSFLYGEKSLHGEYLNEMNSVLNASIPGDNLTIRQRRALMLIEGHLKEFKPNLEGESFVAKKELCRLIIFLLQGFGEYVGIEAVNTIVKISQLKELGTISEEAAVNLELALSRGMNFRNLVQDAHGSGESEELFSPTYDRSQLDPDEKPFILKKTQMLQVIEIYRVLIPMHTAFENFIKNLNLEELKRQTFYQKTLFKDWEREIMKIREG